MYASSRDLSRQGRSDFELPLRQKKDGYFLYSNMDRFSQPDGSSNNDSDSDDSFDVAMTLYSDDGCTTFDTYEKGVDVEVADDTNLNSKLDTINSSDVAMTIYSEDALSTMDKHEIETAVEAGDDNDPESNLNPMNACLSRNGLRQVVRHQHECSRCSSGNEELSQWVFFEASQKPWVSKFGVIMAYWIFLNNLARLVDRLCPRVPTFAELCDHSSFGVHEQHSDSCHSVFCPYRRYDAGAEYLSRALGNRLEQLRYHQAASIWLTQIGCWLRMAHANIIATSAQSCFPIKRLPAELRNKIYWHILAEEPHLYADKQRRRDTKALFATVPWLRREAEDVFLKHAVLRIDLTQRLCASTDGSGTLITYDNFVDGRVGRLGNYIDNVDWLQKFTQVVLSLLVKRVATDNLPNVFSPRFWVSPDYDHDRRWETAALNVQCLLSLRNENFSRLMWKPELMSIELHLGSIAGKLPNLKGLSPGVAPRDLTPTERVMCTHRDKYGQMSSEEYDFYTWNNPPPGCTRPSQVLHFGFDKPSKLETAHKFGTLTEIGDFCRSIGQKLLLKSNVEDEEGIEWPILEKPQCPRGTPGCKEHAGADVIDLYRMADLVKDMGDGLWLCSE